MIESPEYTFALVKPEAVKAGHARRILERARTQGLSVVSYPCRLTRGDAEEFYAEHKGKPHFANVVDDLISDRVVAAILRGRNAVLAWRELLGATDPCKALPGTIRHDFGTQLPRNAARGLDSVESAQREIQLSLRWMRQASYIQESHGFIDHHPALCQICSPARCGDRVRHDGGSFASVVACETHPNYAYEEYTLLFDGSSQDPRRLQRERVNGHRTRPLRPCRRGVPAQRLRQHDETDVPMMTEMTAIDDAEEVIHDVNVGWVGVWRATCPCSFREEHDGDGAELRARAAAVQHLADNGALYRAKEFASHWGVPLVLPKVDRAASETPVPTRPCVAAGDRVKSTSKNARLAHIVASFTRHRLRMHCGMYATRDQVSHEASSPLCKGCAARTGPPA